MSDRSSPNRAARGDADGLAATTRRLAVGRAPARCRRSLAGSGRSRYVTSRRWRADDVRADDVRADDVRADDVRADDVRDGADRPVVDRLVR